MIILLDSIVSLFYSKVEFFLYRKLNFELCSN